jgi:DNA mismatch repair ATPase MutS
LGKGNKGTDYTLRKPFEKKQSWTERLLHREKPLYFEIAERDESGIRAMSAIRERGINEVANAVSQSADNILDFFIMLRYEMGFYIACLNLQERLIRKGEPTCIPDALTVDKPALSAKGLYDVCLSLRLEGTAVGNELAADDKELIFITGANQGGKSTFLRSVGLAYVMMQCGMFVPAEQFSATLSTGIFTHFKREEDVTMKSGKLDEELSRMSQIADKIKPSCVLLCNESFASTNEREGSEIARQIVCAMLNSGIRVLFVTHMFDLAEGFYERNLDIALFLRAERKPDGQRTFKMVEGKPLPTSFGGDLYRQIFYGQKSQVIGEQNE